MSNKIFEAIIHSLAMPLFNKLTEKLNFKKKEKENVASGIIDGAHVTIFHEGEKLTIIIPDDKLSEEKCRKIAKKIIKKLYQLMEIEIDLDNIEIKMKGFASGICNFCLIKAFTYKCHRCRGYYCGEHRLPEKHNCPGNRRLQFQINEDISDKEEQKKDEKSEKVIILESHCG